MVRVQILTGMRPGELLAMKPAEVDRSNPACWLYRPARHKTSHKGKHRPIGIGPKAQAVLGPWLDKAPAADSFVFSPARWEAERVGARAANRKTPRWPSHMARNAAKRKGKGRKGPPGERYRVGSYNQAIGRACGKAGVGFTAYQIRHRFATDAQRSVGTEATRVAMGHASVTTTEVYVHRDEKQVIEVMSRIGWADADPARWKRAHRAALRNVVTDGFAEAAHALRLQLRSFDE